jgi:hypothetical protein
VRSHPREWKTIVHLYSCPYEDAKAKPADQDSAGAYGFECEVCSRSFSSGRSLAAHKWSKHRLTSEFRKFVDDWSICPICKTDFHSRARLVKHLAERRQRAMSRKESCCHAFLASNPTEVDGSILHVLEARDRGIARSARLAGHSNILATRPSIRLRPSILKRVHPARTEHGDMVPRRRLRAKTTVSEYSGEAKRRRCA